MSTKTSRDVNENDGNGSKRKPKYALKELTHRHRVFCKRWVTHGNATKAAIEAGFVEKWAGSTACHLLDDPLIQQEIARLETELSQVLELDAIRRREHVAEVVAADLSDFLYVDEDDNLAMKPLHQIPKERLRALSEIVKAKDGSFKLKLKDSLRAVDISARMDGDQKSTNVIEGDGNQANPIPINMTNIPVSELKKLAAGDQEAEDQE